MHLIIFDVNYFKTGARLVKDCLAASRLNEIIKIIQFFHMFALRVAYDCITNNLETQQLSREYQIAKSV